MNGGVTVYDLAEWKRKAAAYDAMIGPVAVPSSCPHCISGVPISSNPLFHVTTTMQPIPCEYPQGEWFDRMRERIAKLEAKMGDARDWIMAANQFIWAQEHNCPARELGGSHCNCGLDEFLGRPRPFIGSLKQRAEAAEGKLAELRKAADPFVHWAASGFGMCADPTKWCYGPTPEDCDALAAALDPAAEKEGKSTR